MELKKVVVAVDMDPAGFKTLAQISGLNLKKDTEIHLVHVFEYSPLNFEFMPVLSLSAEDLLLIQKAMEDRLEGVQKEIGLGEHPNVVLRCLVSEGARQEFLQYVDEERPDLVVAASQEKEGLRGIFEGSFTSFLTKYSSHNLLILRPE